MARKQQPEVITSDKWVRAFLGGQTIADSRRAKLLRAHGQIPVYYFPQEEVAMAQLEVAGSQSEVANQGEGPWPDPPPQKKVYTIQANGDRAKNAAWLVEESADHPELVGHIAFVWQAMDAWYEEDEQVRFHPHDPYHLIDVHASSRHVTVRLHEETIAETKRPILLFEAGLPPRYYIPKADVRMDLLALSDKTTHCAYKGIASYYSAYLSDTHIVKDIAWTYPYPNYQYAPIQNLVAFAQEGVDDFYVDGERLSPG